MLGNYVISNGSIDYVGNKCRLPLKDVQHTGFLPQDAKHCLTAHQLDEHYYHLHNIDNRIFRAAVEYFYSLDADWCNLPLTTKMISSPGEVYAGKKLNYTTDALPIRLRWFDTDEIFLAESAQFYLELRLMIPQVSQVFSIYNSFRKEKADFSHLAEFQHIEYEGKVSFERNIEIYTGLLRHVTREVLKHNGSDLGYYLTEDELKSLHDTFNPENIVTLTFIEAMEILHKTLGDDKYKEPSLKHFGSFEEIALTRALGKHCNVTEFPLEEIPFYHDEGFVDKAGKKFAKNADLILLGYREVIGSGRRITSLDSIRHKADFFNLPMEDYEPYIAMREADGYETTCGFGMGWQRYTQWLLKMPYIWDLSHTPRGEHIPRP